MVRSLLRFPSEIYPIFDVSKVPSRSLEFLSVHGIQCLLFLRDRKERVTFKEAGT